MKLLDEMVTALKQPTAIGIVINIDTYINVILSCSKAWEHFNLATDKESILKRKYATFKLNPSKYIEILDYPINKFKVIKDK